MKPFTVTCCVRVVLILCALGAVEASGQTMKFNKVSIRDPMVNNIDSASLLVPEGWKLEGGVVWMPLFSMQANLLVRVSDPKTGASVDMLPAQQFNFPTQNMGGLAMQPGSNWMGSVLLPPPRNAAEFVQTVYIPGPLAHLRTARLVKADDMPKLAEIASRGVPGNLTFQCARLRYAYDINGRAWEEDVYTTLTFSPQNGWTAMWWCSAYAMRAPAGQLDAMTPILTVPVQSTRTTLEWYAMLEEVRKVFRNGQIQGQQDQIRFQQQWTQYRAQATAAHQQAWQERQASQDRQNFAVREILGGVETYKNPFESHAVQLPHGYNNYWVNAQGTYVMTSDPNFDPRPGTTDDWRRMDRYAP